ncbi:protein YgfX [Dyella sp. 2RAB6]|uniref:protein YgfX n=1 Tax=Dyella sp. 2RAB6 TaxID=3232992 RepID=UPI003F8E17CF
MTSAPAIGFEYAPSRLLARSCAGLAWLALLAVWLCGMPWWGKCAMSCVLAAALLAERRRWLRPGVTSAGWAADGGWTLRDATSTDIQAMLLSSRVLAGCVWLRLRLASGPALSLLLAPDNSDADLRRRLRMRLAAALPAG